MKKTRLSQIKLPKIDFLLKIPFMERWKFGRRYINIFIPLVCLAVLGIVTITISSPLFLQLIRFRGEIKNLDLKINDYEDRIKKASLWNKEELEKALVLLDQRFSPYYSLSYILNSLTKLGERLDIRFISIDPGSEMPPSQKVNISGYRLKVLPIGINLESEYKKFAEFMDNLSQLPDCFILVKGYTLQRDDSILPRLSANLELEAYILEKIGGQLEQRKQK